MSYDAPNFEGRLDDDLSIFLEGKLTEARLAQQNLKQAKLAIDAALTKADKYVVDCETKLKALGLNLSSRPKTPEYPAQPQSLFPAGDTQRGLDAKPILPTKYNPGWSYLDKIKYVLRNPSKYGFSTFKGAGSVVKAIFIEEPQFRPDEKSAIIQVAPQVSRVVKNKDAVKVLAKGSKVDYHFISAEWFDETGRIKPQHQEAVEGLDLTLPEK
jgi:hypothetical protein